MITNKAGSKMPHRVNVIIDESKGLLYEVLNKIPKRKRAELLRSYAAIGLLSQKQSFVNAEIKADANGVSNKPVEEEQAPSSGGFKHSLSDFS